MYIPNTVHCAYCRCILCCRRHCCPHCCPHPYQRDKLSSSLLESPFPPCQEGIVPRLSLSPPICRYPRQCSCPDIKFIVVVVILVIFVIVVLAVFVFVIIENTPLPLCQECIGPQGWLLNQNTGLPSSSSFLLLSILDSSLSPLMWG